jgi:hypothetical protein
VRLGLLNFFNSLLTIFWTCKVILLNMTCGRYPWKSAEPTDQSFLSFIKDDNFLLRVLPISKGLNTVLKRCFKLHPLARPSISQIREAILKLDTLFLTDEELEYAPSNLRAIAQYYATPVPEGEDSSDSDREGTLCDDAKSSRSRVSSIDTEEVYLYSTPPFHSPRLLAPPVDVQFPGDSSSVTSSDASSDSGVGPVTPATHPVDSIDIMQIIPDLSEDQNIGESAIFPLPGPAKAKPAHISVPNAEAKSAFTSRSLFKRAMKRIKAMGI